MVSRNKLLTTGENMIRLFFTHYPSALVEEKLWDFYMSKLTFTESFIGGNASADLVFYEDLLQLIHCLKYMEDRECSPRLVAPIYTEQTSVTVEGIVNLIKQAIPAGIIYNLSKEQDELDLLIVLERSCTTSYTEYDNIIDLSLLGYPNGICTVHNYGMLNSLIQKGHMFYATACIEENIVYRKSTYEAFPVVRLPASSKLELQQLFQAGMERAHSFYSGAQLYHAQGRLEMSCFMLQQTAELTYRCLLKLLRGKDVKTHSLTVLLKHLKRYAPEIVGIFAAQENHEIQYLDLLEDAYVKSRYHLDYTIENDLVNLLVEKVGALQTKAHLLFNQRLQVFDRFCSTD